MTTSADILALHQRIWRAPYVESYAAQAATAIDAGVISKAQYIANVIAGGQTQHSTKPALIVINYFEGAVPTSSRLDVLSAFCLTQYGFYASYGVANPEIGCYEGLGAAMANEPSLAALISGKTLDQVIINTYTAALGYAPSQVQIDHFKGQWTYYFGLYVQSSSAADSSNKAYGAVIGQILFYGGSTAGTQQNIKATAWLTNAGNGTESYSTPL